MVYAHAGQIGPWKLLERIGKGGGGDVFSGRREDASGKTIRAAIKIVYFENPRDQRLESLKFEHELLKKLRSPYIPKAYDSGFETQGSDTYYWIAFEEVKGDDLRKEISKDGALTRNELLNLMHDVLKGLESAHQVGIIHRDIKPENLIRNSRKTIILDFGGGSYLNKDDVGDTYKAVSLGWAAPENLDYTFDPRDFPASLDLFQAAAVFVYAGTKKQPWPTPAYLRDAHLLPEPQKSMAYKKFADEVLRRQAPNFHDLPDDIAMFLKPLLHRDPNKRGTATEALHRLAFMMPEGNGRTVHVQGLGGGAPRTPAGALPAARQQQIPPTRGTNRPLTNSELAARKQKGTDQPLTNSELAARRAMPTPEAQSTPPVRPPQPNANGRRQTAEDVVANWSPDKNSPRPPAQNPIRVVPKKRGGIGVWVPIIVIVFVIGGVYRLFNPIADISMPDFTGLKDSVAYSKSGNLNPSDVIQNGNDGSGSETDGYFVCAQSPAPSTKISSDSDVTFVVAPNVSDCQVSTGVTPNLAGMELDLASNLIQALGSAAPSSADASSENRTIVIDSNWTVCTQNPAPDSPLKPNEKVELFAVKTYESCP